MKKNVKVILIILLFILFIIVIYNNINLKKSNTIATRKILYTKKMNQILILFGVERFSLHGMN